MMKKSIYVVLFYLTLGTLAYGQEPSWSVDENKFQYTMTFVSVLNVEGMELSSTDDKIAAFVNGECRGVANLIQPANSESYYAYLTVFSNEPNNVVGFKIYDSNKEVVVDAIETKVFDINAHFGSVFQPFSFSNTTLGAEAELLSFELKDIEISESTIQGNSIFVTVDPSVELNSQEIVFSLSSGAQMYYEGALLESGISTLDFSQPVIVKVISEDKSLVKEWYLNVNQTSTLAKVFKIDAVCYAGGKLKVFLNESDEQIVVLKKSGNVLSSKTLIDGEVLFTELEEGEYTVVIGAWSKNVTIELKE